MRVAFLVALAIFVSGCGDDEPTVSQPLIETYTGTYLVRNTTEVIGLAKQDSVTFVIIDGLSYSFNFREIDTGDQQVDFCDCDGRLDAYTSSMMDFVPQIFLTSNCDTLRVPRGEFSLDFRTHAPEIYIEKTVGDSLFRMIVIER